VVRDKFPITEYFRVVIWYNIIKPRKAKSNLR